MQTHTPQHKHTRGIHLKLYPLHLSRAAIFRNFRATTGHKMAAQSFAVCLILVKGAKCANAKICEQPRQVGEGVRGLGGSISMHALIRDSAGHMLRVSSLGFALLCFALDRFGSVRCVLILRHPQVPQAIKHHKCYAYVGCPFFLLLSPSLSLSL